MKTILNPAVSFRSKTNLTIVRPFTFAALAAGLLAHPSTAQAGHVYAGIIDDNGTPGLQTGDALAFVDTPTTNAIPDGSAIDGANLGTLTMSLVTAANPQLGLYRASSPTFTALSRGLAWESGAYLANGNAFAAMAGSFIILQIVSVSGPANGAQFSFWEGSTPDLKFTYTVGTGLTAGSGIIELTDRQAIVGNGTDTTIDGDYDPITTGRQNPTYPNPFNDPLDVASGWKWNDADGAGGTAPADTFGHLHGRSFTASAPGAYTVTYVLKDTSGQHDDSTPFTVNYSAVPEPGTWTALLSGAALLGLLRRRRFVAR